MQLSRIAALTLAATSSLLACALPWDTQSADLTPCERAGYCPPSDGGVDSQSDVIIVVSDGDAAPMPDSGVCPSPTTLDCNGTCVDPTQPAHCGSCTNTCDGPDAGSGQATCTAGVCGLGCSSPTSLDCNGTTCVDPSQPANCGSCGNACAGPDAGTGDAICTVGGDGGGTCSVMCTGTTSQTCGASCYALTDTNHCGSCTTACLPPPSGNGQPTCTGTTPTCGVTCTTGSHVCSADCLPNADEPSDTADPCILTETFGVFVAPTGSDTTGTGTRAAPYATVGNAMDQAKTKGLSRVYACGSAGSYTTGPNLVVGSSRAGLSVYGGLDCTTTPATWTYNAADKATVAPPSGYALQVTAGVTFEDFAFISAPGSSAGPSSIAVFASGATGIVLERCTVEAGTGAVGESPAPELQAAPAPSGSPGNPPTAGPPKEGGTGGAGASNASCSSMGGNGGSASSATGQSPNGTDGSPGVASNGQTSTECALTGSPPTVAGMGGTGTEGAGATDWATFTSSGWSPLNGQPGSTGGVGQGGGGGAAFGVGVTQGGGGGGGAGGCGGAGGAPGTGGGSSIALLLYDSTISLASCTLTAAAAGIGGNGAAGQSGQPGGLGGTPGTGACGGGEGGGGGTGGGGGGGAGGVSAGVVWTGTAPTISGGTQTFGAPGAAGQNGDGTTTAKAGAAGAVMAFQ